ncbi:hypothetical protein ACH492_26280 [Streptomyces sp. NPDC019443]|uniref:hypothetical protein n=1 Tax=Streptomyces sp. NPDC019443 TaxID=3365061 RepID=UPI00379CAECA
MTKEAREALVLGHIASENRHVGFYLQLVGERVYFDTPTILARPGFAPSLPLPLPA